MSSLPVGPAALLMLSRLVSLALAFGMIPLMIRLLGGIEFASWSLLLALGAVFGMLDFGRGGIVRHLVIPVREAKGKETGRVLGNAAAVVFLSFAACSVAVLFAAGSVARALGLSGQEMGMPEELLIILVFLCVALRCVMQLSTDVLVAAGAFRVLAGCSIAQSMTSNSAAVWAAWYFRRLDAVVVSYWASQLGVLLCLFVFVIHTFRIRVSRSDLEWSIIRPTALDGLRARFATWSHIINYQFDKFVIAGLVGLWAVGPYEVANRSIAALRSVPLSAVESFLPSATLASASGQRGWEQYLALTRLAAYGAVVFLLAPLAVAPLALYAWTGEMGYFGLPSFALLAAGTALGVIALPAETFILASGRTELLGKAAIASILLNVVFSFACAWAWGLTGIAVGTALAMSTSSLMMLRYAHRLMEKAMGETARKICGQLYPALVICTLTGLIMYATLTGWIAQFGPTERYAWPNRVVPGMLALGTYLILLAVLVGVEYRRRALAAHERDALVRAFTLGGLLGASWREKRPAA